MKERIDRHNDGSIKARGHVIDQVLAGYWEWFRKDGTKMRSGYFENGKQVGEWTTYERQGKGRQNHEDEVSRNMKRLPWSSDIRKFKN